MSSDDDTDNPRKRRRIAAPETSPYVLRELIDSVPVAGDGAEQDAYITCVEYWSMLGCLPPIRSLWDCY